MSQSFLVAVLGGMARVDSVLKTMKIAAGLEPMVQSQMRFVGNDASLVTLVRCH